MSPGSNLVVGIVNGDVVELPLGPFEVVGVGNSLSACSWAPSLLISGAGIVTAKGSVNGQTVVTEMLLDVAGVSREASNRSSPIGGFGVPTLNIVGDLTSWELPEGDFVLVP